MSAFTLLSFFSEISNDDKKLKDKNNIKTSRKRSRDTTVAEKTYVHERTTKKCTEVKQHTVINIGEPKK